jgi:hypothetical protein
MHAAGGLWSTAHDMSLLADAFISGFKTGAGLIDAD